MARLTMADLLARAQTAEANAEALVEENERLIAEMGLRITQAEITGIVYLALAARRAPGEVTSEDMAAGLSVASALLTRLRGEPEMPAE